MPGSSKRDVKTRQRGVRASRAKLQQALRKSGFKTQVALAEHIASIEGLDTPPKDLVSKAFREILIEPQSLERIAVALQVEAYTLYQNQQDEPYKITPTKTETVAQPSMPKRYLVMLLALVLLIAVSVWFFKPSTMETQLIRLPGLKPSLLIYPQEKSLYPAANQLKTALDKEFQVAIVPLALHQVGHSPTDLKSEFQSDWVVTIEALESGRHMGIRLYLSNGAFDYVLFAENISQQDMLANLFKDPVVIAKLGENTNALIETETPLKRDSLLSKQQQQNYLKAKQLVDDYQSFDSLNTAQQLIEDVLREHPFYGPAHAVLCEISIHESWRENEKDALERANQQCQQAASLSPNNLNVQSAIGFLQDKTGQRSSAQKQYEDILHTHSSNVEALMGLATVYFNRFRNTGDNQELVLALDLARQATKVVDHYWRPFQLLATIEFTSGNRENAIAAWESQVAIKPNELTLSNLGLMYLCKADFERSKAKFEAARALAPNSYMPLEGLASISYYQASYAKALSLRLDVQSLIANENAGIHQQWGDLADTYRQLGQLPESRDAYRTALKILERDLLRGNTSQDDVIYRLYYQLHLLESTDDQQHLMDQLNDLETVQLSAPALARKALVLNYFEKAEESQRFLQQASSQCPVYNSLPEFNHNS